MGRVKSFDSITKLQSLLVDEGFVNVTLSYLGGLWVMFECDKPDTKRNLINHVGINSWFQVIQEVNPDFVSDERVVWLDIEGVPLYAWSRKSFDKIGNKWGEVLNIEDSYETSFGRLKKPVEENLEPSPSLSHPPGFSPVGSLNSSDKELNKEFSPTIRGILVLGVLGEMISGVGSTGHSMEGCEKDNESIINSTGDRPVFIEEFLSNFIETGVMGIYYTRFCWDVGMERQYLNGPTITEVRTKVKDEEMEDMDFRPESKSSDGRLKRDENSKYFQESLNKKRSISSHPWCFVVDVVHLRSNLRVKGKKKKALLFKLIARLMNFVRWDFLLDVLEAFGFGSTWCTWIRGISDFAKASLLVNGSPSDEFHIHRGLKQGDPLSPFLFILVMELAFNPFCKAVDEDVFKGIQLQGSLALSHLFYADDAFFMGEWSDNNLREMRIWLHLRFHFMENKFRYLGVMVGAGMTRHKAWDDVILKLQSRLSKWKAKTLLDGTGWGIFPCGVVSAFVSLDSAPNICVAANLLGPLNTLFGDQLEGDTRLAIDDLCFPLILSQLVVCSLSQEVFTTSFCRWWRCDFPALASTQNGTECSLLSSSSGSVKGFLKESLRLLGGIYLGFRIVLLCEVNKPSRTINFENIVSTSFLW
ncbi:RNA-directed DNA polymerase, eukaryota [Tanacetum coccineum]